LVCCQEIRYITASNILSQKIHAVEVISVILSYTLFEQYVSPENAVPTSKGSFGASHFPDADQIIKSYQLSEFLKSEEKEIIRMVLALVIASADHRLKEKTTQILKGICYHLALLCYNCDKCLEGSIHERLSKPDGLGEFRLSLNTVLISSFADSRPAVQKAGRALLCDWLIAVEEVMERMALQPTDADNLLIRSKRSSVTLRSVDFVVKDLLCKARSMCLETTWALRLAGARVINELCALLPSKWCLEDEADIIDSLLCALKHTGNELMLVACEEMYVCLKQVIQSNHDEINSNTRAEETKVNVANTVSVLVNSVISPNGAVRSVSKSLLGVISELRKLPLLELLRPLIGRIQNILVSRSGLSFASSEGIGLLSAYSFFLSAKSQDSAAQDFILAVNVEVLSLLREVIEATEGESIPADILKGLRGSGPHILASERGFGEHDDLNLAITCLPKRIPIAVELRLQVIRLINVSITLRLFE